MIHVETPYMDGWQCYHCHNCGAGFSVKVPYCECGSEAKLVDCSECDSEEIEYLGTVTDEESKRGFGSYEAMKEAASV